MKVTILDIDATREAQLLRLMFEHLGADVRLTGLGKPTDFFSAFDFYGDSADLGVICGHGDDGAFLLPEMAPGVDTLVLPGHRLTAQIIARGLQRAPAIVVSTACDTGHEAVATAFFAAGTHSFAAPCGFQGGASVPVLLSHACYRVCHGDASWPAAIEAANALFLEEHRFTVFSRRWERSAGATSRTMIADLVTEETEIKHPSGPA